MLTANRKHCAQLLVWQLLQIFPRSSLTEKLSIAQLYGIFPCLTDKRRPGALLSFYETF
jgi:hypothetical protein